MKRRPFKAALLAVVGFGALAALGFAGDSTIDGLTATPSVVDADEFPLWKPGDAAGTRTKKVTAANLKTYMAIPANPLTAQGDMIYGGAAGAQTRLPIGTNGQALNVVSGLPTWTGTNWPAVTQTASFPNNGGAGEQWMGGLNVTNDYYGVNPNFSNVDVFSITLNSLNGLNFNNSNGAAKTSFFAENVAGNFRACGQRFLRGGFTNFYGMGDAFESSPTLTFYGGYEASGDEGQGGRRIVFQGPTLKSTATISSVAAPATINTTTTQIIAASISQQTVTVASSTGVAVGQWVTIDPQAPATTSYDNMECVKVTAVAAGTITARFNKPHASGVTVLPATVLTLSGSGRFGQHRLLVNLTQPSYTTGTASTPNNNGPTATVTGVSTVWTTGMVGGSTTNVGLITFTPDNVTGGGFSGTLIDYYQIAAVASNTSLTFATKGYKGTATVAGAYTIYTGARIEWFDGGNSDGSGGDINGKTVVLSYNTFTWNVNDSLECALSPEVKVIGDEYQVNFLSQGCQYNQVITFGNYGLRKFNNCLNFTEPGTATPQSWGAVLNIQSSCGDGILFNQSNCATSGIRFSGGTTLGSSPHIMWGGTGNNPGIYWNNTATAFELQMVNNQNTIGTANKGKLKTTSDSNTLANFAVGGYLTPDNGVIDLQTTLTGATTIANTDKFQTYLINGATFAVTLPAASGVPAGKKYRFKKIDTGAANNLTAAGADKIDGAATFSLSAQFKHCTIESDGSANWYIISSNFLLLLPLGRRRMRKRFKDSEPEFQQAA